MTDAILLIEDNAFDARVFRYAVEEARIELPVMVASDGVEALEVLHQRDTSVDLLIVTDLNMPRMNGIELIRTIRQTVDIAHLPVFVVTTSDLESDMDQAHALGIEGVIRKSGDERELIDPIVAYLAKQGGTAP